MEPARDPFVSTLLQLLDEERALRAVAEERVRGYMAVLFEMALMLAPEEVERRRHADPYFPLNQDPGGWREFVQGVRVNRANQSGRAWAVPPGGSAEQATAGVGAEPTQATNGAKSMQTGVTPAVPGEPPAAAATVQPTGSLLGGGHTPALSRPAERPHPGSRIMVTLPPMPPAPPEPFAASLGNWEREGLALAAMAITGWSNRLALADVLGDHLGISPSSGSIKRLFDGLVKAGFCRSQTIEYSAAPPLRAHILTMTEQGQDVMAAAGIGSAAAEWDQLAAPDLAAGGSSTDRSAKLAAVACAFTYQARRRGYRTDILPPVEGSRGPEVEITRDGEEFRVAVDLGASGEERLARWRNLADQVGYAAICTPNSQARAALADEAGRVCEHGKATDLEVLIGAHDAGAIWMQEW
jgi:hypothetical protein